MLIYLTAGYPFLDWAQEIEVLSISGIKIVWCLLYHCFFLMYFQ